MSIHEPCPESEMNKKVRVNTICATLRQIYRRTEDPEIRLMVRVATTMAKKMSNKLEAYKKNWDVGFWE